MDDDIARRVYSDPVARWFVTEAYRIVDTAQLVAAAGAQLVLSGIPLYRLAYFLILLLGLKILYDGITGGDRLKGTQHFPVVAPDGSLNGPFAIMAHVTSGVRSGPLLPRPI